MKWRKLGKIFDPTEHQLPGNCTEYAQSPQTLVFDDFVRIYFSTRARDKKGMFLSHIAYIDAKKDFKDIIDISSQTVIELGELGTFDEHGIFPINPFRDNGKVMAYTCGWSRRVSVAVETSTGLAISHDEGKTFKRMGSGPILTSSLNEPFLVGDSFVCKFDDNYHMWYMYGARWILDSTEGRTTERVYKIGYAMSDDGINWRKQGKQLLPDKLDENECQALPTVIYHDSQYHMLFCYRHATRFRKNKDRSYRIGYAYSDDLVNWIRDDEYVGIDVSEEGWDADMMCYPHLFHCDNKVYLLYNGNEFGRLGFGIAVLEE